MYAHQPRTNHIQEVMILQVHMLSPWAYFCVFVESTEVILLKAFAMELWCIDC
jgi:hypothetical protein